MNKQQSMKLAIKNRNKLKKLEGVVKSQESQIASLNTKYGVSSLLHDPHTDQYVIRFELNGVTQHIVDRRVSKHERLCWVGTPHIWLRMLEEAFGRLKERGDYMDEHKLMVAFRYVQDQIYGQIYNPTASTDSDPIETATKHVTNKCGRNCHICGGPPLTPPE